MLNDVYLILGSNIDKEKNLPTAVYLLHQQCPIKALSTVYETVPVGLREQPNFFNVVIYIQTEQSATQLKKRVLAGIETQLKRVRVADKNAPRTIDLDIVLFNDAVFDYDGGDGRLRRIPDPDLLKFAHIATPLAELIPDKYHPETGESFATIAARLHNPAHLWPRPDIRLNF